VVKPTRSTNRTETTRRSAADGASRKVASRATGAPLSLSDAPHSRQNLRPRSLGVPHASQGALSTPPHSPQNFAAVSLAAPQCGQMRQGSPAQVPLRRNDAVRDCTEPAGGLWCLELPLTITGSTLG